MKKTIISLISLVLVIVMAVAGTLAWLTAKTDPVENTFTVGDINIDLAETTTTYKIIPGTDIAKDPKVTVEAESEACWLFVKVDEANWPTAKEADGTTRKVEYAIADGWTALEGQAGVFYREVSATDAAATYAVLKDDKVTVSENLTKAEMEAITTDPTLTFTAYAIQKENIADAATAWSKVSST